ncbi:MAG TPA: ATP-binding protein [Alphaproteobacteria bacterium]|nr:ATP-binding protein [Alphaproteobacteria bacterium]
MKIVLTGGPSCGKTSVIEYFKKRGHDTIDEVARQIIAEKNWQNKKLSNRQFNILESEIYAQMIEKESYADSRDLSMHFMDRSLIDIDGYCLHRYGRVPKKYQKTPTNYNGEPLKRYHKVFVLDRLPLINDGLRLEDSEEEAQRMHDCIIEAYKRKGYEPIRVPIIPVVDGNVPRAIRKRAEFIKNNILGLDTINEEYEKIQDSYSEARARYNFNKSIDLHVKGYNPISKKIIRNLMSGDNSW